MNNTLVWVLAFAPIIGYLMGWFVAGATQWQRGGGTGDGKRQLLVHHASRNLLLLSFFDEASAKGRTQYQPLQGLVWLGTGVPVPARQNLQQAMAYFIVWLVCFAQALPG